MLKTQFHSCLFSFNRFVQSQKDLEEFIETSDKTLALKIKWDDFGGLLKIMTALKNIGERESSIESLFHSLQKIIYMLLQYSVRVPRKCTIQVWHFVCCNFEWPIGHIQYDME